MKLSKMPPILALVFGITIMSTLSRADDSIPNPRVQIDSITRMSPAIKAKVIHAAEVLERVINSGEFYLRIELFRHGVTGREEFQDNMGFSNAKICRKIFNGAETLKPDFDQTLNLTLYGYTKWNPFSSTIGKTSPDVPDIGMAKSFIKNATTPELVGNLMHEWLHKAGFSHSFEYNESRNSSVPYAIGNIACEVAAELTLEPCRQ